MSNYHRYFGLTLVIIAFVGGIFAAATVEGPIPVHWNAAGEVDGWMDSPWGLLVMPATMLGTFLLFQVIGIISPSGFRLESFSREVGIFQNAILFFLALVFAAQLLFSAGIELAMDRLIMTGMGALLVVVGNFFGKTRKNFFIGIRTPWTLASDEVWVKTHRLGGWLFVAAGILLLVAAPLGASFEWLLGAVIVASLVPVVYSLLLYRQLEGFRREDPPEDDDA